MKKTTILILFLAALIGILAFVILNQKKPSPVSMQQEVKQPEVIEPSRQPIVHYPVPSSPPEPEQQKSQTENADALQLALPETLPPVQQSDVSAEEVLAALVKQKSAFQLLKWDNFIQKLVVTIDSLPEKRLPKDHLPISRPLDRFTVSGTTEEPQTSPRNHQRYTKHVELFESIAPEQAVKAYAYFYPLFQAAYKELGYPNAYFNDRLVYVIDHLLETPEIPEPILLAQPSVLYVYASPSLEKRSSGQKILLRIGPEYRGRVLNLLKQYRELLVSLKP